MNEYEVIVGGWSILAVIIIFIEHHYVGALARVRAMRRSRRRTSRRGRRQLVIEPLDVTWAMDRLVEQAIRDMAEVVAASKRRPGQSA